jgi:hypothetical protein
MWEMTNYCPSGCQDASSCRETNQNGRHSQITVPLLQHSELNPGTHSARSRDISRSLSFSLSHPSVQRGELIVTISLVLSPFPSTIPAFKEVS